MCPHAHARGHLLLACFPASSCPSASHGRCPVASSILSLALWPFPLPYALSLLTSSTVTVHCSHGAPHALPSCPRALPRLRAPLRPIMQARTPGSVAIELVPAASARRPLASIHRLQRLPRHTEHLSVTVVSSSAAPFSPRAPLRCIAVASIKPDNSSPPALMLPWPQLPPLASEHWNVLSTSPATRGHHRLARIRPIVPNRAHP